MKFPTDMLCRLNGCQPTLRQRWYAFYRLYRMTCKDPLGYGQECWMTLFEPGSLYSYWRHFCDQPGDCHHLLARLGSSGKELRLSRLRRERRERLHGRDLEWMSVHQYVARVISTKEGIEMTPDEVAQARIDGFRQLREQFALKGLYIPSDHDLLGARLNSRGIS